MKIQDAAECAHKTRDSYSCKCLYCDKSVYLYEVDIGQGIGANRLMSIVKASDDKDAIKKALARNPHAIGVQKDHWGRGPYIKIIKAEGEK